MDRPDNAIETTATVVWIDDGIIHIQMKGTPSTGATVTETLGAVRDLLDGVPRPVLFDVRNWPMGGSPEAWTILISEMRSIFSAAAAIIDPASAPKGAKFPTAIDRLLIPFKEFTDESDALAFLKGDTDPLPTVDRS